MKLTKAQKRVILFLKPGVEYISGMLLHKTKCPKKDTIKLAEMGLIEEHTWTDPFPSTKLTKKGERVYRMLRREK